MLICPLSLMEEPGPTRRDPRAPGRAENIMISLGLSHICPLGWPESLILRLGEPLQKMKIPRVGSLHPNQPHSSRSVTKISASRGHKVGVQFMPFLLNEGDTQFSIGFLILRLMISSGAGSKCCRIMTFKVHLVPLLTQQGPPALLFQPTPCLSSALSCGQ